MDEANVRGRETQLRDWLERLDRRLECLLQIVGVRPA
jgi:hypothetical protein